MPIKIIKKAKELVKNVVCPPATQDLELNTKNRDAAIESDHIQYGPMNLEDESYWDRLADHWKTTPEVAKESNCSNCAAFDISPRMKECMPGSIQEDGQLGTAGCITLSVILLAHVIHGQQVAQLQKIKCQKSGRRRTWKN